MKKSYNDTNSILYPLSTMITQKYILSLLLALLSSCFVFSQNITFSHINTNNGLSQFSANSLYVDSKGMIWIGTREGLNCYNGNGITAFKLEKDNPNSLFCNSIIQIVGNHNEKLFLLCEEGVAKLDIPTEQFTTLLKDKINYIHYADQLYLAQKNTIYTLDEKNNSLKEYFTLPDANSIICAFIIDHNGHIWIGTVKDGLYIQSNNNQLTHVLEIGRINSIYEDSRQEIWIGTQERGLYHLNRENQLTNYRHRANDPHSISSNFIRTCCEDNIGNIWIGTYDGLNKFNRQHGQFTHYHHNMGDSESISHGSIWSIVKDQQGTIWIGTYFGGVNYFNPEYEIYTHHKESDSPRTGLSSPIVGRILEDHHGRLWIATEGGGINMYDRNTGEFEWIKSIEGKNSLSSNNVKALYHDEETETMWIGTHLGGLNKLNIRTNTVTHYKHNENDSTSLPSDIIRDIIGYKGRLIIATQNGLCYFDPHTGKAELMFADLQKSKNGWMIADVMLDSKQNLWFAATSDGVYRYDFNTRTLENYRFNEKIPNSLSNNNINNIMEDSNGNLWFSTSGSGLDLYRPASNDFENFDAKNNGLLSDCIYEVRESSVWKGSLLVITNQGFSHFNTTLKLFTNYNTNNGFPISAINENALYVTRDGNVFLGGIEGLISFEERKLHFISKPYSLQFVNLLVNGKEVLPGDDTGILAQSLPYTDNITLNARQSNFTIYYSSSNHISANRANVLYKLENYSDEWTQLAKENKSITYTNLNPGQYTLIIKSTRNNIDEARISITVLPPWYRSTWAILLYIIVTVLLIWYIAYSYISQIRLKESLKYEKKHLEDIEKLNQDKLRFFTNISHEFRTPLTVIVGQMESLLKVAHFTPTVYQKILGVYKSSIHLRELISELLDFRKQEQGQMRIKVSQYNIVSFLNESFLFFFEYAKMQDINLVFQKSEDEIDVWFDAVQLQKVVNNLISNALKHTAVGGEITLSVYQQGTQVIIEVKDNGSGIAEKDIQQVFDRFYQSDNNIKTGSGSGIGLALTKGIVELHHGFITVQSEEGKGATFQVILPLGYSHFNVDQISKDSTNVQQTLPNAITPNILDNGLSADGDGEVTSINDARIMIVEDNESIRLMLVDIFSHLYQVTAVSDGKEAWALLQDDDLPDLILSDVMMPEMPGTELCRLVKTNFQTCHIPVVLLTARTALEYNIEGLRIGADDYITKPFNVDLLLSRCNNLINSRRLLQEKFSKQPQTQVQMLATNAMDKEMLDKATAIIEEHLDNPDFNVNMFAREMAIARTSLFTKLKAITGQTPNDFILSIRLKRGAYLLRNNMELNISEISDKIGFSTPKYFRKCFKDMYKVSPLIYRRGDEEGSSTEEEED